MAVAVVLEFDDATLDQYDEVIRLMGLAPRGMGPPGALFHWVTQTPEGLRVTDVWESRERFEQFAAEEIGPHTAKVGMTATPRIMMYEVHNYLTAG